ncbi:regulatory LacI family protein [Kribbella antiqua]|uniref:Regulatory LacI family protein n=1 Tax=Kribbella antiqua TaxID=2512217 RepID=A0A4R2IVB2_9ACTN|nr:LacI family DNA-binding transcriptional regulator [Kribbella antiqua]TCO49117.1 regulatory LacI family protein [Kribbella antiqua]
MPRVTIKEIARRAGVSKGAVSYALNNQPGVSEATRARVLRVAEELEWVSNRAARALSAARSETFGLVLARTAKTLTEEPFYMGFVGGVESVLAGRSYALALQVVSDLAEELSTYRKWAAERRVDGVIVVDLRVDDPRIPLLRKLGLPAVLVGDPAAGRRHGVRLERRYVGDERRGRACRVARPPRRRTRGRTAGPRPGVDPGPGVRRGEPAAQPGHSGCATPLLIIRESSGPPPPIHLNG